ASTVFGLGATCLPRQTRQLVGHLVTAALDRIDKMSKDALGGKHKFIAYSLNVRGFDLAAITPRHVCRQLEAEGLDQEGVATCQLHHAIQDFWRVLDEVAHGPLDQPSHILAVERL